MAQPIQSLAIDERMVKYRHNSGIRQYIQNKPIKWEIKLWSLADRYNGYTIDFDICIGKAAGGGISRHGFGYDVVMKLIRPLINLGHLLYFDNFYISLVKDSCPGCAKHWNC